MNVYFEMPILVLSFSDYMHPQLYFNTGLCRWYVQSFREVIIRMLWLFLNKIIFIMILCIFIQAFMNKQIKYCKRIRDTFKAKLSWNLILHFHFNIKLPSITLNSTTKHIENKLSFFLHYYKLIQQIKNHEQNFSSPIPCQAQSAIHIISTYNTIINLCCSYKLHPIFFHYSTTILF